jgi:hypothetical protein
LRIADCEEQKSLRAVQVHGAPVLGPHGRVVGARGATRSGWPLPQPGAEQVGRRGLGRRPQARPSAGIARYSSGASFRPWRSCGGPSGAPCGAYGGGGSLLPSLARMAPLLVSGQSFLLNGQANISARRLAVNQLAALGRLGARATGQSGNWARIVPAGLVCPAPPTNPCSCSHSPQ